MKSYASTRLSSVFLPSIPAKAFTAFIALSTEQSPTDLLHEYHHLIIRDLTKNHHDIETTTLHIFLGPRAYTPSSSLLHDAASIVGPTSNFRFIQSLSSNHMELVTLFQLETSLSYHQQNTNITSTLFSLSAILTSDFSYTCSGTFIVTLVSSFLWEFPGPHHCSKMNLTRLN